MEILEKKRLTIAICDDEAVPLSRLRQMAEQTLGSHWALEIICTDSPEALLEQAERMQIALLDIQLPEQNGIALAQCCWKGTHGAALFLSADMCSLSAMSTMCPICVWF